MNKVENKLYLYRLLLIVGWITAIVAIGILIIYVASVLIGIHVLKEDRNKGISIIIFGICTLGIWPYLCIRKELGKIPEDKKLLNTKWAKFSIIGIYVVMILLILTSSTTTTDTSNEVPVEDTTVEVEKATTTEEVVVDETTPVESEETVPVEETGTSITTFDPSGQYQRWSVGNPTTNDNIEKSETDYITPGGETVSPDEYVEPGTYTATFTGFDPYMSIYHAPNFQLKKKQK